MAASLLKQFLISNDECVMCQKDTQLIINVMQSSEVTSVNMMSQINAKVPYMYIHAEYVCVCMHFKKVNSIMSFLFLEKKLALEIDINGFMYEF